MTTISTSSIIFILNLSSGNVLGDLYFDTPNGLDVVKQWFKENVEGPLANNNIILFLRPGNHITQLPTHYTS